MQLPMLLQTLIPKIDHARAVQQLRKAGHLALILPYLKQVLGAWVLLGRSEST